MQASSSTALACRLQPKPPLFYNSFDEAKHLSGEPQRLVRHRPPRKGAYPRSNEKKVRLRDCCLTQGRNAHDRLDGHVPDADHW